MDNDKALQINVTAGPTGQVLLGNPVQELKDETKGTFSTDSLQDFIDYLTYDVKKVFVFFDMLQCRAFDTLEPTMHSAAVASCKLSIAPILNYLLVKNGQKMPLVQFEEFLRTTRNHLTGGDSMKLLDLTDNLQISKVKTVTRQKDNAGKVAGPLSRVNLNGPMAQSGGAL